MKLNRLQLLWVVAFGLFVLGLLFDVANAWNMQPIYMLMGASLLVVTDWLVMPSLEEIDRAQRRRRH